MYNHCFSPEKKLTKGEGLRYLLAPSHVENKLGVEHDMRSLDSATSNINEEMVMLQAKSAR